MRDLKNNIDVIQSLAPASRTVAGNGTGVDLQGFNSACVIFNVGTASASADHTFEVQESDDDVTYTAVAAADLQGAEPQVTTANHNKAHRVGYIGNKRWIRAALAAVVVTSPPSTLISSASVIRSDADHAPVA